MILWAHFPLVLSVLPKLLNGFVLFTLLLLHNLAVLEIGLDLWNELGHVLGTVLRRDVGRAFVLHLFEEVVLGGVAAAAWALSEGWKLSVWDMRAGKICPAEILLGLELDPFILSLSGFHVYVIVSGCWIVYNINLWGLCLSNAPFSSRAWLFLTNGRFRPWKGSIFFWRYSNDVHYPLCVGGIDYSF